MNTAAQTKRESRANSIPLAFEFCTPVEPKPALTLEEELAALTARSKYLRARMESADRGYGRFASLNAQTYRHKLARIQERQIEIREQLEGK